MSNELTIRVMNCLRTLARTARSAEDQREAQACIDEMTAEHEDVPAEPMQVAADVQAENAKAEERAYSRVAKADKE